MTAIWSMLNRLVTDMPPWVKITAFFTLLSLTVYLFLIPKFLNGQLIAIDADSDTNGFLAYRGTDIHSPVEGRTLKYQSNEGGYWSVPIVSRLPQDIKLHIRHQDSNIWYPVVIPWKTIWLSELVQLQVTTEPEGIKIYQNNEPTDNNSSQAISKLLAPNWMISTAIAGELILPKSHRETSPLLRQELEQSIFKAYASIIKRPLSAISRSQPLIGKSAPSYLKKIKLIREVEIANNLTIPDHHWQTFSTLGELSDYLSKRKQLEATRPKIYKSNDSWSTLQQNLPPKDQARFIQ